MDVILNNAILKESSILIEMYLFLIQKVIINIKDINKIASWVHAKVQPDLTILLDAPAEIGMQRAKKRGAIDRMESEDISFYERVRNGYLTLASEHKERFVIIDATQSLKSVQAEIAFHLDVLLT